MIFSPWRKPPKKAVFKISENKLTAENDTKNDTGINIHYQTCYKELCYVMPLFIFLITRLFHCEMLVLFYKTCFPLFQNVELIKIKPPHEVMK